MIGEKINSLKVVDNNNGKTHLCEFDDLYELYCGEMVILDLFEIGNMLAESLKENNENCGGDEITKKDIMNEIEEYFDDVIDKEKISGW